MPLFNSLLTRFGLKQSPPIINDGRGNLPSIHVYRGSTYSGGMPGATWTGYGYLAQAEQGYKKNADVYSCISLIATAAKQVRWWDHEPGSKSQTAPELLAKAVNVDFGRAIMESTKQLDPRPSLALLIKAGGAAFIEQWVSYILLSGNAYIEIERLGSQPWMLFLDRPDRVGLPPGAKPLRGKPETWRVYNPYGAFQDLPKEDLVQSKLFNPLNDVFGMAPLDAAMLSVDTQNEGATLLKRVLQRGFAPGWIEAREDSLWSDTQVAQLKAQLLASKQAGEELFLENAKWHPMGFPPADAGVSEHKIFSKRDIAAIFHVPSQLIGDTQSQTYANYREARRALYTEAVIPLLTQFKGDWNRTIGAQLRSPLDFDKDSFDAITAAREEATDRVHKLWTSGLITQNEGRSDLEYEPRGKEGDVFYAPANFVPLASEADQE
jgi:HK97 family phage portal protein